MNYTLNILGQNLKPLKLELPLSQHRKYKEERGAKYGGTHL
jgi:hypothetical protein